MFDNFEYKSLKLNSIILDIDNPRIVTINKLTNQSEIIEYLFEYEDLSQFIKKIASEGKNFGAERPYVVKKGREYVVVEGNTRIAAYKVLSGLLKAPAKFSADIPSISASLKTALSNVDCSISPSRDALMPIMANAHFGLGDKSKWGYLGSRKAVYNAFQSGKSVGSLAATFDRTEGQIRELIIEFLLYMKALGFKWSKEEKKILTRPSVPFNPPVRFLQTKDHKDKVGIVYDMDRLAISFKDAEAEKKFQHLVYKLVVAPKAKGMKATASYEDVFADFGVSSQAAGSANATANAGAPGQAQPASSGAPSSAQSPAQYNLKAGALFSYPVTVNNALIHKLMDEAKDINANKLPASATFLLRSLVESLLKNIIDQQKANPASVQKDLESSINLCLSSAVSLPKDDVKILKTFQKQYVTYLNLGAHGNVIPNATMVFAARDCIDQFIKKNI